MDKQGCANGSTSRDGQLWARRLLIAPLLMVLTLVLGLLVASGPAQAQPTSLNLQASGQDIDSSTVAPNTAVTTQSVSATDSLSGSAGWAFQMGSPSQVAITNPEISVESGNPASNFSSAGGCPGVTAETASLPFTWSEAAFPGEGCPGPYQLTANLGSFTPITFSPGFDSYRTVNTASVAAGGTQTMTVGVTARASDLGTAAAQLSVQWSSSGQTGMVSASVTDTGSGNPVPNCPQPDPGTAACLSSAPTTFPNPGSQWTLNHPVVADEYDFRAVLNNTSSTAAIISLPNVTVTGTPNNAPPDIQNQTSTGTSATLLDSTLDGSTPGSGAVTFSAGEEANWTLNLQHQVAVLYQGYPTQGGGGGGPQLNSNPNMGLSDGQTVSVSDMGLASNEPYTLQECNGSGCDPTTSVPAPTDSNGNFIGGPLSFTVHQTITVNGNAFTCTAGSCSIEATDPPEPSASASISFGGGSSGPQLNSNPNMGLSDGQTVSVSDMGLASNEPYTLQECNGSGCDPTTSVPAPTDSNGNFIGGPLSFTVHQTITVNGNAFTCTAGSCSIEATDPPEPSASASISFGGGSSGPQLNSNPNMGLSDGQTVSVSDMGLASNEPYTLQECNGSGCDPTTSVPAPTDSNGNFIGGPLSFTVHQTITVNGNAFSCTAGSCSIEATDPPEPSASASISFGGGSSGPQLNVEPNSMLGNGSIVDVWGTNLSPNISYQLQECDVAGCDPSNSVGVSTDGTGSFVSTPFTVGQDITVNGSPVNCAVVGCSIEATGGPQQPPPTQGITFGSGGTLLNVTPSNNLNDQSIVAISASGLQANVGYQLEECTSAGCDPSNNVSVSTDGTGTFASTPFTVNQDINVNGTQVDCAVASCSIEATGQGEPAPSAQISFFLGNLYPSTTNDLVDNQPISVTSNRLEAGTTGTYSLYECTAVACDPSTLVQTTTDFLGHISMIYTVHQHISYTDPVTGNPDQVDCFSTQCSLQAFDTFGAAATSPENIWFAGSPLQDASLFGTVTLPGGKALPAGTQSWVTACEVGQSCTSGGAISADVTASTSYGMTTLTPGQAYDVVASAVVQTNSGPVTVNSAQFQVTPTAGQVVINNFVIEGFTPLPSGDFVTGRVTDLDGNPLPASPFGGPGFSPQSGVLACPGTETFGGIGSSCTDITNLLTPTDAAGNYNFWLPAGQWNLAPFTTFAGIPGAPAITGAYQNVTVQPNIDPVVNLVIPLALTLTYTGATVVTSGATSVLSGKIVDQNGNPVGDQLATLSLGTQSCTAWTGQTTGVATCPIVVSQAVGAVTASMALTQDPQYEPSAPVSGYVQAPQTITFTSKAPTNAVYGGTHYKVTATGGGSRNPVTFSLDTSSSGCSLMGAVVNFTGVGTCVIDANQAGNTEYSHAPQVQQSFAVAPASTRTALSLTTVTYGAEASSDFAVKVSATRASPTGTVAVKAGTTTLCTITLSSGTGECSLTAAQLPAGRYPVAAVYSSATPDFSGSSSAAKTLVVNAASTTTALSVTTPVTYGAEASAEFTVTVSATGATPTGTVAVNEGSTTLCTITLSSGTGECSVTAAQLPARSYTVVAVYSSTTANFSGSRSTAETLSVTKAGTTLTAKAPTTTTSGANTTVSSSGTLTSSVNGLPIVGQKVTFTLNGTGSPRCSATTNSSGVATCSLTVKTSVYDSATSDTATYVGNADYLPSEATEPA